MNKKIFCVMACAMAFAPISGWTAADSVGTSQTMTLDQEIKKLKDQRTQAQRQAYIAGTNADQWLGQSWTNYQEAIKKQEMCEQRVKELNVKIAELEKQKAALK